MARLKRLGVIGENAPTRRTRAVVASDFNIAGEIGFFERRYKRAYAVNNPDEFQGIFGGNVNQNWYGSDGVKGFFDNLAGQPGTLYVKAHVGNDGTNFDAATASANITDQQSPTPENILTLESAYREELEFSESGNRTGYTIENGARFSTTVAATGSAGATSAVLASVIGVRVGDIVKLSLATDEFRKITAINESARTISFSGGLTNPLTLNAAIDVLGFRVRVYRQSITGVVNEVEPALGAIWCTTESEVSDFYVENIFRVSSWLKISRLVTTPTDIEDTFPPDVSTITYLSGGANGSSPTSPAQYAFDNSAFDNLPVRIIYNIETSNNEIQRALELYCKSRTDTPLAFTTLLRDQDKQQLIETGNSYQRSDDVFQVLIGSWLGITDPFTTNPDADDRHVPSAGHIAGLWIRATTLKGIHYIPTKDLPILGVNSVVAESLGIISNQDRTDIAQAGVNLIQNVPGSGIVLRNMFTPSTSTDFQFANGIFMRNFVKISAEDSLQESENTPNSFNQVRADRDAVRNFMLGLWGSGSTGTVPSGETFAQFQLEDGSLSTFSDSVQVNVDPPINTNATLQAGERYIEVYFAYPAPAGRIVIRVGLLLPA